MVYEDDTSAGWSEKGAGGGASMRYLDNLLLHLSCVRRAEVFGQHHREGLPHPTAASSGTAGRPCPFSRGPHYQIELGVCSDGVIT